MIMSTNVGTMLNSMSCGFMSEQKSIAIMEVRTSRMRFMAAHLSGIFNTSPVLRRAWKDKERFRRWSNASRDTADAKNLAHGNIRNEINAYHDRNIVSQVPK